MNKVYLAGPDVFAPDVQDRFARLHALCLREGFEPVRPADAECLRELRERCAQPEQLARRLFELNMQRLRLADCVLANLNPFRGPLEPDSGTVFEVSAAVTLGKPVAVYFEGASQSLLERAQRTLGALRRNEHGEAFDPCYGQLVEDFGLPMNLMLACSCPAFENEVEALRWLARQRAGEPLALAL